VHQAAFETPLEARIVDRLRGAPGWDPDRSLVAEDERGRIVGHVVLFPGRDDALPGVLGLGPIGVLPDVQGRGVGGALMGAAIELAERAGAPAIVLLGHAGYYPRFGFVAARSIGIDAPEPWSDANWMARPGSRWVPSMRGVYRYPPAFDPD
jgi:putative acetyltransferase